MTPLGLNTAAVPEAAALFPLAQATPAAAAHPAANGAAGSFSDLLAASFGDLETPANVAGDDAPVQKGLSMADTWFATLNIDFSALNASLESEESATPSTVQGATAAPISDADSLTNDEDADDDEAGAALVALTVPVPVPVVLSDPLPQAASATPAAAVNSASDVPSIACDVPLGPVPADNAPVEEASSIQLSEPEEILPQSNVDQASLESVRANQTNTAKTQSAPEPAASAAVKTAPANAAVTVQITGQDEQPRAIEGSTVAAPVVEAPMGRPSGKSAAAVASVRAPERQPDASVSESVASAPQTPSRERQQQQGQTIDVTPAVQQNDRTRDTVAAKLADISGLAQSASSDATVTPTASQAGDEQEQSETQDGSAQEAFALGVQENAVTARSADGGSPAPVFSVTQPVASAAAPASVHAPEMPHAPTFTSVPDPQNVSRMIESMRVQIKDGIQEATVHLKPEHLGEVTIVVRVERGAVSAIVHTDAPAVQQWLEAQEEKLRSGLSDQGLHLERFHVHRDGSQEHREQARQQTHTAQRYRQPRNDSAIRFEVLV